MNSPIQFEKLVSVRLIAGEDDEETNLLKEALEEARSYLKGHSWCHSIEKEFFGLGVGGVVSVFLFKIKGQPGVDDLLWVVTGDLPSAYFVTDKAKTPVEALDVYCGLMDDWIAAIKGEKEMATVFPVNAEATRENAFQLEKRVAFLRDEVIPSFKL